MHPRTKHLLSQIGLRPKELAALDAPALHALPTNATGFGLIGPTGCGKTWALVQALGTDLDRHVATQADPSVALRPRGYARWLNWPDQAEALKGMVAKGYHADIVDLIETWEQVGMLFLDDLGQERITGANDYSLGVLRALLDTRYRQQLPVYWTSNLLPKDLVEVYGARIVSRMKEAWPWTPIQGRDMRLQGVTA